MNKEEVTEMLQYSGLTFEEYLNWTPNESIITSEDGDHSYFIDSVYMFIKVNALNKV